MKNPSLLILASVGAVNGVFYVRTPVKVEAESNELIQITEGLCAGDQAVASPGRSQWMAELQVLTGLTRPLSSTKEQKQ